jgi:hypothetical protein
LFLPEQGERIVYARALRYDEAVNKKDPLPFGELGLIADRILEKGEDQPEVLADELDQLSPAIRDELLTSDLMNAFQVFYYFFRQDPGDLERERLTLQPASALATGVMMSENDLCEVIFSFDGVEPVFSVSDGEQVIARCHGTGSYRKVLQFLDETL